MANREGWGKPPIDVLFPEKITVKRTEHGGQEKKVKKLSPNNLERYREILSLYRSYSYASPATFFDYLSYTSPSSYPIHNPRWEWDRKRGLVFRSGGGDCDVFAFNLASQLRKKGYKVFLSFEGTTHTEVGVYIKEHDRGTIIYLSPSNYESPTVISHSLLKDLDAFKDRYPTIYKLLFFRGLSPLAAHYSLLERKPLDKVARELERKLNEEITELWNSEEGRSLVEQLPNLNPSFMKRAPKEQEMAFRKYLSGMYALGFLKRKDTFYFKPTPTPTSIANLEGLDEETFSVLRFANRILLNQVTMRVTNHLPEEEKEPYFTLAENLKSINSVAARVKGKAMPDGALDIYRAIGVWEGEGATLDEFLVYMVAFRYALDVLPLYRKRQLKGILKDSRAFARYVMELYKRRKGKPNYSLITFSKEVGLLLTVRAQRGVTGATENP